MAPYIIKLLLLDKDILINKIYIDLIKQIKTLVQNLPTLNLSLDSDYLVIETNECKLGWGGALYRKLSKYDPKTSNVYVSMH